VPEGAELVVRERLTQQDISERVGSSREMVARVLKHLTQGQYLVARVRPHHYPSQAAIGLVISISERPGTRQLPWSASAPRSWPGAVVATIRYQASMRAVVDKPLVD
jgi:hypothetical protein